MKYIGNKIWHEATDNSEKMMCHISKEQFESMQKILDSAVLNYYTYEKENICRVAMNKSDIAMVRSLLGSYINFIPTSFSYSPATLSEKQLQFLERLERFAVSNNITENLLDGGQAEASAYRNSRYS